MRGVRGRLGGVLLGGLVCAAVAGCGSTSASHAGGAGSGPLRGFQLAMAGTQAAADLPSWHQYGARPVDRTLTINPVTVYDSGSEPLTLLGIRQLHPVAGLVFGSELVTITPGFSGYSEYVNRGQPGDAFGFHANFDPLRGFVVNPDPHGEMTDVTPTIVLTARVTHPGEFHIGNWAVSYRVGAAVHTLVLSDDGEFCAGRGCPSY